MWNLSSVFGVLLGLSGAFSGTDETIGPMGVIKSSNERVLAIYRAHSELDDESKQEIVRIIEEITNVAVMARNATKTVCGDLTEEQCQDLNDVFREILKSTSMHKVGRSRVDRFEYLEEEIDSSTARVRTLAHHGDQHLSLDYVLELDGGGWKIVNYIADDVDTVRNYRKQFRKLFSRYSFDEVIKRLNKKLEELRR